MLKVAVIGLGNIGNTHAPVYQADPLAELVAVCDIIPERADKAVSYTHLDVYKRQGFIGAVIGSLIVLGLWRMLVNKP